MSLEFLVLLLAMAPISELRAAIPVGIIFGLPFWKVFLISFFGNLIPVIFILLFLESVSIFLSRKSKFFKNFFEWLFKKTRKKASPKIKKYEEIGLVLFVAIPLPVTGGWAGSVAAFLLGIPFKVAFPLISLGVLIAGIIVSSLTLSGIAVQKIFGWKALAGVLTILVLIYLYIHKKFVIRRKL